jgi:beta-glucosidase
MSMTETLIEDDESLLFPAGFVWGGATAAYQIEGAAAQDGRGPSIWDTFSRTPGNTTGGDTGDVAVDHYHRYRDDVALMRELNLGAYRFSVSWSRVQPTGRGPANPAGLAFYDRLTDELLAAGIDPWVTLYHWDLPQALEDAGGWPVRDTAERFAEYALLVHTRLGDRVRTWTTLNEPFCSAFIGYAAGRHAPGRTDPADALRATHHLLLGHGLAVEALRAADPAASLGITLNLYAVEAASADPRDIDAARRVDGLQNRLFLDPVLRGAYPADVLRDVEHLDALGPAVVRPGDPAVIAQPLDFLGVNYYTRHIAGTADTVDDQEAQPGPSPWAGSPAVRLVQPSGPVTAMDWEVYPDGLRQVLTRVHREYPALPLVVTENGAAYEDSHGPDGTVEDGERTEYLATHLRACYEAIAAGVPLRGYFVWSLFDNFEWGHGYSKRFGIVHVDYDTQRRTPKRSGRYYARVARDSGLPPRHTALT